MSNTENPITIPFKVSARTARLIGRENIATSIGAIIELVKNGYDADSKISLLYFDNYYSTLKNEISEEYYHDLQSKGVGVDLLDRLYGKTDAEFVLNKNITNEDKKDFQESVKKLSSLYIIDSGEGMTQDIIRNHWMTIGTDNKASDFVTKTGRIKAGAKGIGRFALDKLGSKCEMTTIFNPSYHKLDVDIEGKTTNNNGYKWIVNWEDFEGEFKTIEKVGATLIGLKENSVKSYLEKEIPSALLNNLFEKYNFQFGTILKITELRDNWEDFYIDRVFSNLEVLVPPKESGEFAIFLYSSFAPSKYGEILGSVCDDFDYKIIAEADNNQNLKIKIVRNEYDIDLIPPDFYHRPKMQLEQYKEETFRRGYWETAKTFSQLMPGFTTSDEDNTFDNIGSFHFTFYYLKRTYNTTDAKRFFNKKFLANTRKDWLDKFGGVKLFRDNFRVRPYGEVNNVAFDWLGLGSRKALSPAGIAKEDGGYKVEPANVAGAIKISRLTNVNFEDKSSREGLQENKTFDIFKELITKIISILENDRAFIAREMSAYNSEKYATIATHDKAKGIIEKVVEKNKQKKEEDPNYTVDNEDEASKNLAIVTQYSIDQEQTIERLKEEQKILRGMASSGLVLASFSHDLSKLSNTLESRTEKLKSLIAQKISEVEYRNEEDRKNPFYTIEQIRKNDLKLQSWLNFALGAAKKDKRKRKQLFLRRYLGELKSNWKTVVEEKGIDLNIEDVEDIDMRVFEIDFDSIFNNLLINSIESFLICREERRRAINISVKTNSKEIIIDYADNGNGLSKDIEDPQIIFEPLFTTKRNKYSGEETGTGLGMWIIESIIKENDGDINLLYPNVGFAIRFTFPIKYKRNN